MTISIQCPNPACGKTSVSSVDVQGRRVRCKCLLTLREHTGPIRAICFRPDGNQLATAGIDRTIKLWDATPLPD